MPFLRQRVQTLFLVFLPFSIKRADWRFGFQVRGVFLLEWLTLFPKAIVFPQSSHALAMFYLFVKGYNEWLIYRGKAGLSNNS